MTFYFSLLTLSMAKISMMYQKYNAVKWKIADTVRAF